MHVTFRNFMVFGIILLTLGAEAGSCFAVTPRSVSTKTGREETYCFFGALRKDGRIMVSLNEGGGAGRLYRVSTATPVMLNGLSVGQAYLKPGMPIILVLSSPKDVYEILVRGAGGK